MGKSEWGGVVDQRVDVMDRHSPEGLGFKEDEKHYRNQADVDKKAVRRSGR